MAHFLVKSVWVENLASLGAAPLVYYTVVNLCLVTGDPPRYGRWLPLRLNTGTGISIIPVGWLDGEQNQRPFVPALADPISFDTSAGANTRAGRAACGVRFQFLGETTDRPFDLLVSSSLDRPCGLLALHDVLRYFHVQTEDPTGPLAGAPGVVAIVRLVPKVVAPPLP